LRELIALGGQAFEALLKNIDLIRQFQSNEGMTLMDAKDTFETHQYNFSGLDDILSQFAEQISGAVGIPLVR
ncbi:TPA: phage portal protein, partial [Escherichia coli]